jgi:hypothetical protein
MQTFFLGDSHCILLTENSLLLFSFDSSSFIDELKLWQDEKTARYIRDYNLTDMDILEDQNIFWICVGNETGNVIFWKITINENHEVQSTQHQVLNIYSKTRTKRVKWVKFGDQVFLVTVSTAGDISIFDVTNEMKREFTPDKERTMGAIVERKMEVRITQLDVVALGNEIVKEKKEISKGKINKNVNTKLNNPKKKKVVKKVKTKKIKKVLKKKKPELKKGKKIRVVVKSKK